MSRPRSVFHHALHDPKPDGWRGIRTQRQAEEYLAEMSRQIHEQWIKTMLEFLRESGATLPPGLADWFMHSLALQRAYSAYQLAEQRPVDPDLRVAWVLQHAADAVDEIEQGFQQARARQGQRS